jgi:hypothetical protein
MEITFNAFAYKHDWHDMAEIESGKQLPSIWGFEDKTAIKIGTAVVTVTLFPKAEIHTRELAILNKALQEVRAENHVRENAILDRISKLTAITYEVAE